MNKWLWDRWSSGGSPCLTGGLIGICIKLNLFHLSHQIQSLNEKKNLNWICMKFGIDVFKVFQDFFMRVLPLPFKMSTEQSLQSPQSPQFYWRIFRSFFEHFFMRVLPSVAIFHLSYGTLSLRLLQKVYASK